MKWSFKIAEIAGIKIQVHLTFLIIVAWFALAYWQMEGTLRSVLEGVSFILALFFCVVLHELGHALTARKFGIKTRSISLLPIGGVSAMQRHAHPSAKFLLEDGELPELVKTLDVVDYQDV